MSDLLLLVGSAVIAASVRGSMLLLGLWALGPLLQRVPATSRHLLWSLGFIALFALPVLSHLVPAWPISVPDLDWRPTVGAYGRAPAAGEAAGPDSNGLLPGSLRLVLLLWATTAAVLSIRLGFGLASVSGRFRRATPVEDADWCTAAERLRRDLGIRRRVALRVSDQESVPVTYGLIRPTILLPASAIGWSAERRRVVLLHELAHIRRCDSAVQLLAELAKVLHWFNPLVWIAARRLREASEQACDHTVVRAGIRPAEYAGELIALFRSLGSKPLNTIAPAMASNTNMERRVWAIMDPVARHHSPRPWSKAAWVVGMLCAVVSLAAFRPVTVSNGMADAGEVRRYASLYEIPVGLASLITDAAAEGGVDTDLAFRLVSAESGFRPDLESSVGAIGLTQLMPATAAALEPGIQRTQLLDPATNLHLGFRLLHGLLDRYQGEPTDALLAYYMGSPRLDRLRAVGEEPATDYARRVLHAGRDR